MIPKSFFMLNNPSTKNSITLNSLNIKPEIVFFIHIILMNNEAQLAMNLGENYLVTEDGNEILGKQKLDLFKLYG